MKPDTIENQHKRGNLNTRLGRVKARSQVSREENLEIVPDLKLDTIENQHKRRVKA